MTNTPDGYTKPRVEITVFNENIGRIGFHRDGIITIVYRPATEGDIIRIDSISTIGLYIQDQSPYIHLNTPVHGITQKILTFKLLNSNPTGLTSVEFT